MKRCLSYVWYVCWTRTQHVEELFFRQFVSIWLSCTFGIKAPLTHHVLIWKRKHEPFKAAFHFSSPYIAGHIISKVNLIFLNLDVYISLCCVLGHTVKCTYYSFFAYYFAILCNGCGGTHITWEIRLWGVKKRNVLTLLNKNCVVKCDLIGKDTSRFVYSGIKR